LKQGFISVQDLALDLGNFRTVRQKSEEKALEAIVATSPDRFWALTESLIADGYLPTESIIVLAGPKPKSALSVKEGNRRVASLKLIHGLIDSKQINIPGSIEASISSLPPEWVQANMQVPCVVYSQSDTDTVDRIVSLAHGKGEKAGKDQWNAVARARHNRDAQQSSEPALDLLEEYLASGKNLTQLQKSRWSGDYPLTVLEEAIKRIAGRLSFRSSRELADAYPAVPKRDSLEDIMKAIGLKQIDFAKIRDKNGDFAADYGIPPVDKKDSGGGGRSGAKKKTGKNQQKKGAKPKAASLTDSKSVKAKLRSFSPVGKGREKVTTLRDEARELYLNKTPLAFCFVLRCMFEISAKAYCDDHAKVGGPTIVKSNGQDRQLVDVLQDITDHLTQNGKDKKMVKDLHGAMSELKRRNGLLSVTSMNQLMHNPRFSIIPSDICVLFHNIFPLLEAMNS
jgi:hypothetical protein